jgi:hypothetical protein
MSLHAWDNMHWHNACLLLTKVINSQSCYVGLKTYTVQNHKPCLKDTMHLPGMLNGNLPQLYNTLFNKMVNYHTAETLNNKTAKMTD